ncbi:Cinnamoyl-CoA reductase 1 [Heracleum sosnowskyi]|uniref:Dihydroflavonol 4-reductase n=1 Tax=Heracleum sosnowskyi TaxID=360622 RepID=A0AAD8GSL0_9APIA|nr:Cinnamoyl-CoA reductase 1 [Heracleum sosnowskyi]
MDAKDGGQKIVCVTGGSVFIGSWAYDEKETKHLQALEEHKSNRLHLFQIDLLDYDSIVKAISGVAGVFHLASPCNVDRVDDPEKELLEPEIKGTKNVPMAAKELGVRRVVITSSMLAIIPSPYWPADVAKNEDCWTDVESLIDVVHSGASKTLAEKAAWEFAKEKGLDMVVVNPGAAMGPILPPTINTSMLVILRLLQETYEDLFIGSVHVKDVALAHMLVYENPSASGRHLRFVSSLILVTLQPSLPKDTNPVLVRSTDASKKLMDLGLQFTLIEQIIKDSVESLKSKGFLP